MNIRDMYDMLCDIYGIGIRPDIESFIIVDSGIAATAVAREARGRREALFIREAGNTLELGLYIAPSVIAALSHANPLEYLDEFGCVVEGVSHFLYVADRAEKDMRLTMLELELQAEVDKFLISHLLAAQGGSSVPIVFFERLFERCKFDPSLSKDELGRYKTASHFAAKYCSRLRSKYFNPLNPGGLVSEVRKFFECDLSGKITPLIP